MLVMLYISVCFDVMSVSCSLVVTCWGGGLISRLSFVLCFLVLYHFPKCVLIHIRIKGEVGAVKLV